MEEMSNESLGSYVKKMRDEKNISIEQVAYATRISLKMLRALEEDDHTALPAPTFVRGYLQAYAKYVRIDTQDLLLRYQHHLATAPDTKKGAIRSHYLYVRERYQEKRRLVLVIVLFVAMLSVAGTYFLLKAKRERNKHLAQQAEQITKMETAKAPEAAVAAAAKADESDEKTEEGAGDHKADAQKTEAPKTEAAKPEAAKPVEAPAAAPAPAPKAEAKPVTTTATASAAATSTATSTSAADEKKAYNALLRAEADVWLRFQTDEDPVRDLTLREGKALMLRANKVIKIFSGNLGALKATMNGAPLPSLAADAKSKSAVLPQSEAANYPPPLFPQFQTSRSGQKNP
jgi:cytoskeleton protein RodZ